MEVVDRLFTDTINDDDSRHLSLSFGEISIARNSGRATNHGRLARDHKCFVTFHQCIYTDHGKVVFSLFWSRIVHVRGSCPTTTQLFLWKPASHIHVMSICSSFAILREHSPKRQRYPPCKLTLPFSSHYHTFIDHESPR